MNVATRVRGPGRGATGTALALLAILSTLLAADPVTAQRADFLFGRPAATVAVMTGWTMPGEDGDLFSETRQDVTVGRGDFATAPIQLDAGIHLGQRLDLTLGFEYAGRAVEGEWREWVTMDDRPIFHTTEFRQWRTLAGLRAYLFSRGRTISDYVWIPGAWSPYVTVGAGVTWYNFTRRGDFVVSEPGAAEGDIYEADIATSGRGFTPFAAAGLDVTLSPHFVLRLEGRRYWGAGGVDPTAFEGYGDIDLSGVSGSIGIAFRTGRVGA